MELRITGNVDSGGGGPTFREFGSAAAHPRVGGRHRGQVREPVVGEVELAERSRVRRRRRSAFRNGGDGVARDVDDSQRRRRQTRDQRDRKSAESDATRSEDFQPIEADERVAVGPPPRVQRRTEVRVAAHVEYQNRRRRRRRRG